MRYMLDTNICIYIIKQKPSEIIKKFHMLHINDLCISSLTHAELEYGVMKSNYIEKNQSALNHFLAPLNIASFDNKAALEYGKIRAFLENKGQPIGSIDMIIAAHALSLHLTLITNNTKEFSRVPNLELENWITKH